MKTAACIFAAAMFTVPVYAQSSSALCGLDMFEKRVSADYGPMALDSDGIKTASLTRSLDGVLFLSLWDMTNPVVPDLDSTLSQGEFLSDASMTFLSLEGSVVALGLHDSNMGIPGEVRIFDISDSVNPVIRSTVAADMIAVQIVGDRLYVLTPNLLSIYNISDLDAPVSLGTLAGTFTNSLDVVGTRMYLGNTSDQLQIFDVANPASISLLGEYAASGDLGAMSVDGDTAAIGVLNSLVMLDVTDPTTPIELGTQAADRPLLHIVNEGDWVFSSDAGSVSIFDVSEPLDPVIHSTLSGPDIRGFPQITSGNGKLWVRGAHELIQLDPDQTEPIQPEVFEGLVPGALIGAKFGHVDVHQGSIYAIDTANNALHVIDGSPGSTHSVLSTISFGSVMANDIAFADDSAFMMSRSGEMVSVIDISDPSAATIVGSWDASAPTLNSDVGLALKAEGSLLYTSPTLGAFTIHDVSNPLSPVFVSETMLSNDQITDFDVQDGIVIAYSSYFHGGELGTIHAFDCTSPASPVVMPGGRFNFGVKAIKRVNDHVLSIRQIELGSFDPPFASFQSQSLLDDSSSEIMFQSNELFSAYGGSLSPDMLIKGHFAVVPSSNLIPSLTFFDISNPTLPILSGSLAMPNSSGSISVASDGDLLYSVSGWNASLGIYDISSCSAACIADLTGDSVLDFFDVSAFLDAFAAQDPIADFTDDGIYDFFDVSDFLDAFAKGCG